jgi:hypothetical protein
MTYPKTVRLVLTMTAEQASYLEDVLIEGNGVNDGESLHHPEMIEDLIKILQRARHQLRDLGCSGVSDQWFGLQSTQEAQP